MAAVKKATANPAAKVAEAAVKTIAPKAEEKKTEEKKVETAAAPAKAEAVKPAGKKEADSKAVKKTPAKKASVKNTEPKTTVKKASAKKAEMKSQLHIQFAGKSYAQEDLVKIAKDVWKYDLKQKTADLTSVELYVKPEENMVYYVMNKEFTGSFFI